MASAVGPNHCYKDYRARLAVVYTYKVYHSQCCSGASSLIVATSKWQTIVMRATQQTRRFSVCRFLRRPCAFSASLAAVPLSRTHRPCRGLTRWWLHFGSLTLLPFSRQSPSSFFLVFKTLLTYLDSFNICFAILLTLCCTWPTVPKACATPTNSYVHVSVQRLLRCAQGICCKYVHLK